MEKYLTYLFNFKTIFSAAKRINRTQYFIEIVKIAIFYIITVSILGVLFEHKDIFIPLFFGLLLLSVSMIFTASLKRRHDFGKKDNVIFYAFSLVFFPLLIYIILSCLIMEGEQNENEYGEVPNI